MRRKSTAARDRPVPGGRDREKATLRPTGIVRPQRRGTSRRSPLALATALALLALPGCYAETFGDWERGGLEAGITNHADRVVSLWQGAWVAAFAVGAFVWGLIIFAVLFHRRRRGDTGLPQQVRYNVPIEVLYTVVPIVIVAVYFFFTARDQNAIAEVRGDAQHRIEVVGKRWSWDFNHVDADVYETGTPGTPPVLYLPRGEKVRFDVVSRDVIHNFWVIPFLYKMDVYPGRINTFEVTAEKTGTFAGKCAEFCGVDHARMLFSVKVVEPGEYQEHMEELRGKGQVGRLRAGIGPNNVPPTSAESDVQSGDSGSEDE